ncbi:hypothetical protein [Pedobacter sp. Leaf194]|uniref:hypothetical protein n=1 Tax=Pedobacter sp. Leaf194 TaxID=1736297 RepID=UPI00070354E0|nr:hypothetical protein [Pedobacter sp. Leaf194]KQS41468.1 hypothetical protein ASG14_03095 [Pedobacter sp. Leaf194]
MRNRFVKFALILVIAFSSCKNAKENSSTFTKNRDSKEYKNNLAKKIKADDGTLIYSFSKYKVMDNQEFVEINIRGTDYNSTAVVLVDNWARLSKIKESKGIGYSGAELKGLELTI